MQFRKLSGERWGTAPRELGAIKAGVSKTWPLPVMRRPRRTVAPLAEGDGRMWNDDMFSHLRTTGTARVNLALCTRLASVCDDRPLEVHTSRRDTVLYMPGTIGVYSTEL